MQVRHCVAAASGLVGELFFWALESGQGLEFCLLRGQSIKSAMLSMSELPPDVALEDGYGVAESAAGQAW